MALPLAERLGSHPEAEVKAWVRELRHFAFSGAFSNDRVAFSEELVVHLRFTDRDDLVHLLGALGIYRTGDGTAPAPIAGTGSRNVAAHPDIAQPDDCAIEGAPCNVVVTSASITITVSEPGGGVTARRVADARRIEAVIDAAGFGGRAFRPDTDYVVALAHFP